MKPLAIKLNEQLKAASPDVYDMLSSLGRQIYYVREGILSQSAEAKARAKRYNATLGTAVENGQPMHLEAIQETLSAYSPKDIYEYAPTAGKPELRQLWRDKALRENPSLAGKIFGLPIATTGLTHGLSLVADLFAGEDDAVIVPDKIWENYEITFGIRRGSRIVEYPLYGADGRYNTEGLRQSLLAQQDKGKAIVVINFPNNPTGYTPSEDEARGIVEAIREAAEAGIHIVALVDDAYFGLFYDAGSLHESLFGRLAGLHPRILPVRVDGATKEEYVTGLRVGFLTFAADSEEALHVLEQKTMGLIRATISSGPHPSQTFVLHALKSAAYPAQKNRKVQIIQGRAARAKELLQSGAYDDAWTLYPFNSGYFLCLKLKTVDAEVLRRHLLDRYEIGTIALNATDLRLAVPCIEAEHWEDLLGLIYQGVKELEGSES
ncbi:aminotransferase class I/II-fold pyridoxal phosphate-dependent enzyme [Paenibacillus filicis]|uniref:Aminotransferase class I/II-fold pyridoxal phosphate-dependent enzyme n=1 Tax=Paenibacillus filicis TaxID=669464 RepID=A0ABU9DFH9_9BACL